MKGFSDFQKNDFDMFVEFLVVFLLMFDSVDRDVSKNKKLRGCPICHYVGTQIANRELR